MNGQCSMMPHHHCAGCPAHRVTRRGFLQACGAGLASTAALGAAAPVLASGVKKACVGLVYICYPPGQPVWPYVDYDYDGRKKVLSAQLKEGCPSLEFTELSVLGSADEEIPRVRELAQRVDGLLVIALCTHWGLTARLLPAIAELERPAVFADDPYSGSGVFLCNYARIHRGGAKIVGVSSCRFNDVIDVANCFQMLAEPGVTTDAFHARAEAVNRSTFAPSGDLACIDDRVQITNVGEALRRLRASKMLVVNHGGEPFNVLGVQGENVPFQEVNELYNAADADQATQLAERWIAEADEVVEPTLEDLRKSATIHLAVQALMKKHRAQGITINCLGGFYGGHLPGYPCLGYRHFNNELDVVGTCEANVPDMLAMLMCKHLLGRASFASDPVIDTSTNQIVYAHCVAPNRMFGGHGPSNPFRIRSHAEDGKGASIQSLLPTGYMTTTFRINPGRKEMVIHQGKAVGNVDEPRACRTKLAAEVKGDIGKLFNQWDRFSWHRLTVYGDVQEPIEELARAMGLTVIREA